MKFFNKNKVNKEEANTQGEFIKRREKHLYLMSSLLEKHPKFKRGLKIFAIGVLPVSLILIGVGLGLNDLNKNNNQLQSEVIVHEDYVYKRVYLLNQDDVTVPLSVKSTKYNSVHEDIVSTFELLKQGSVLTDETFKGVIPDSTRILSFTLENGELSLNLSKEFLDYKTLNIKEEKVKEAITFTYLQFKDVNSISVSVENELIFDTLNEKIGINIDHSTPLKDRQNKVMMTYFYEKNIATEAYYVPRSIFVDIKEKDNLTFFEGLKIYPSSASGFKRLSLYNMLSKKQNPSDNMNFSVSKTALEDEQLVKKDLYDILMLSMDLMGVEKEVSFNYQGEEVSVSGIYQEEDYEVSSVIYNEIAL